MSLSLDGTTGISASGNITGGNVIASGSLVVGSFSPLSLSTAGNITGGNILTGGLISSTGTITGSSHIGSVVSVTGAITGASVVGGVITGSSASVSGTVTAASTVGGVITGSSASVSGTVTAASTVGGVITGSSASVSGNITGGNVLTTNYYQGNGFYSISAFGGTYSDGLVLDYVTGNGRISVGSSDGLNIFNGATVAATQIASFNTSGALTLGTSGTQTLTTGGIINGNGNGVGNIGSSTTYFNTVFAKATSAQYADLAEIYVADNSYGPGTVVEFGGNNEITATTSTHSVQAAGIISTQPAYLMNSTQAGEHALEVALIGRVPCSVVGTIRKGDRLVSSDQPGVAQALNINLYQPGCIIGKSLEDYNSAEPGVIEVAVGRA